jgi:hypothetical protein
MTTIIYPEFIQIPPKKLKLLKAIKICDMFNPSFQDITGDICYVYVLLKPVQKL